MQILSAYLAGIRCYHVLVDMQYDFVVDFNPESGFFDLTDYGMNTFGRNYFIAGLQSVAEFLRLFSGRHMKNQNTRTMSPTMTSGGNIPPV